MSGHTDRERNANGDTPAKLRAQLDELLAAFDEIAQYGRERRASERTAADEAGDAR